MTALLEASGGKPTMFPACGAALLALAMADLDHTPALAVRMIALAKRLWFLRSFHPIMSADLAEQAARDADEPAYDDAVSSYAGLGNAAQHAEILALVAEHVRERVSGSGPA